MDPGISGPRDCGNFHPCAEGPSHRHEVFQLDSGSQAKSAVTDPSLLTKKRWVTGEQVGGIVKNSAMSIRARGQLHLPELGGFIEASYCPDAKRNILSAHGLAESFGIEDRSVVWTIGERLLRETTPLTPWTIPYPPAKETATGTSKCGHGIIFSSRKKGSSADHFAPPAEARRIA